MGGEDKSRKAWKKHCADFTVEKANMKACTPEFFQNFFLLKPGLVLDPERSYPREEFYPCPNLDKIRGWDEGYVNLFLALVLMLLIPTVEEVKRKRVEPARILSMILVLFPLRRNMYPNLTQLFGSVNRN
jgi:hypothetical protein